VPRLRGGMEVLDEALSLSDHPRSREAVKSLRDVMGVLTDYGVADRVGIDLGMIKDLDYYTGMVLEGYAPDLGFPVCTGGRYDNLIGRFGFDCPATGFVVGVERLMLALDAQGGELPGTAPGPQWLLGCDEPGRPRALAAAAALRARGWPVEVDVMDRPLEAALDYARARAVPYVAWYAGPEAVRVFAGPEYRELDPAAVARLMAAAEPGAPWAGGGPHGAGEGRGRGDGARRPGGEAGDGP
ncbi:MAG: ATP phosphoribosyltransferase regulatory subunit, partial [Limnochordales bacterium]